jgi:molybdate transport system ATP-binding protein
MLMQLTDVTAVRPGAGEVFRGLSWAWHEGETWAVVGNIGAGKTSFAHLLAGKLFVKTGAFGVPLLERVPGATYLSDIVTVVGFQEDSRLFSYQSHYYQERFHFSDPLEEITLEAYLRTGLKRSEAEFENIVAQLGLRELLSASFITLSNGQVRRARIARGVLGQAEVLILDDPFLGLDADARSELNAWLGSLVAAGRRIIILTRPEFVPPWVTHVLELQACQVRSAGPVNRSTAPIIVKLENIRVAYPPKTVLNGLDWTVRQGERWALLGGNGSGKTTLLSLLYGDHPQAYSNRIELFGQRRGTGESIWDVKKRIGLLSPELHLFFHEPLTAKQTAATGFHDVLTYTTPTPEQTSRMDALFAEFHLTDLHDRKFRTLSTGQQRLVLFVRAMVKTPELLILDEPFQSLDSSAIKHAKTWLDTHLTPTQTLILVTHHLEEIPTCVTQVMRL